MTRYFSRAVFTLLAAAAFAGQFGCSSGGILGGGPEVTVAGRVINIDTFAVAAGVRVYLLDNAATHSTTTDGNGDFSLQIPTGSRFLLVTDDPDDSTDDWYPTLNVEDLTPAINAEITSYQIHACPQKNAATGQGGANSGLGSIAVYDNFLTNGDTEGRYLPTTVAASGGAVVAIMFRSPVNDSMFPHEVDITLSLNEEDAAFAPLGYLDVNKYLNTGNFTYDPALGPDILLPSSTTKSGTDTPLRSTFGLAFGDPSYLGTQVTLTATDSDTSRNLTGLPTNLEIPVRDGMLSLTMWGSVNGEVSSAHRSLCCVGFSIYQCGQFTC